MLLTISTTYRPATDLGYLLHKSPGRVHSTELGFGAAHVFYPEATAEHCSVALLLDIDPLKLRAWQRRAGDVGESTFEYVNDRPYVASSFTSVALAKVFGTAMSGNSRERPELVDQALPLTASLSVAHCRGGENVARRIFEPLGYEVETESHALDEILGLNDRSFFTLTLSATKTVRELLTHLYVLIPVLDDQKHYAFAEDEVEKLLRRGEQWLGVHPQREMIVARYLRYRRRLTSQALARLMEGDETEELEAEESPEREPREEALEKPLSLNSQRIQAVTSALKAANAHRVLDLGCGEGRLISELLTDASFEQIVGMDVSTAVLDRALRRLRLDHLPERQSKRVSLLLGSLVYKDRRLTGFDAAALVEVIEHLEPEGVPRLSEALFGQARPRTIVVTTPNRDYNALFTGLESGRFRHPDHRFEWTRAEFGDWAAGVAQRYGYTYELRGIGESDPELGFPTQMAVFSV